MDPRVKAGRLVEAGIRPGTPQARGFGEMLAQVREDRGETRAGTAKKLNVSATVLATWERGAGVPGQVSYERIRRWLGSAECGRLDRMLAGWQAASEKIAKAGKATEAQARKVARGAKTSRQAAVTEYVEHLRTPDEPEGEDRLLAAVLGSGLGDRQKALLCAAVVAMVAGVDVTVEIRAAV